MINPTREKVIDIWEEKIIRLKNNGNLKEFLENLRRKATESNINTQSESKPDSAQYDFPIQDLVLVMRTAAIGYINSVLKPSNEILCGG